MEFCFAADGSNLALQDRKIALVQGQCYWLKFSYTQVYIRIKLIIHTEISARESLPCVRGGAERSEAEWLLGTEETLIKFGS